MILEIRAEDRASAQMRAVGTGAQGLMNTLGRGSLNAFAYSQAFDSVGRGLTRAGAAITAGVGLAVKANLDFGHAMALANTQAQLTEAGLDRLSDQALQVSSRFGVAGTEIAESLYDIFSTTEQNAKQAIESVNVLAKASVAGGVKMREATRGVVDIQNAFGKSAGSTTDILNRQFAMLRNSAGTYGELVDAFGNVIGSAKTTGQQLDTVSGAIAFLTLRGRSQAEASISVSRALDQITRSAADVKSTLGVSVYDAEGNFRQLNDIITDMGEKMKNMTSQEQAKAFESMFGAGSIQANRFFRTAIPQFDDLNKSVKELSDKKIGEELARQFRIMQQQDPAFMFNRLKTQITNLGISLAKELMPDLKNIIRFIGDLTDKFQSLDPDTKQLIARLVAFGGAFALVGGKVLTFIGTMLRLKSTFQLAGILKSAQSGMIQFGNTAEVAATKVSTSFGSKLVAGLRGAATTAGVVAGGVLATQFARNAIQASSFNAEDLANKLVPPGVAVAIERQLNSSLETGLKLTELNPFSTLADKTAAAVEAYKQTLQQAVQAGIPLEVAQRELAESFETSLQTLGGFGGSIEEFKADLQAAVGVLENASGKVDRLNTSFINTTDGLANYLEMTNGLTVANDKWGNKLAALVNTAGKLDIKINGLTKQQVRNLIAAGDLDGAYKLLKDRLDGAIKSTLKGADANIKNKDATTKAMIEAKNRAGALAAEARASEDAKRKTDDHTRALKNVPNNVKTNISTNAAQAKREVDIFRTSLSMIDTAITVVLNVVRDVVGNAEGTRDFGGGMTMVGERGPELVVLPRHSQVIPNHQVDRTLANAGAGRGDQHIHIHGKTVVDGHDVARELDWLARTRGW